MIKEKLAQNDISDMRTLGEDLAPRWQNLLTEIAQETGFIPDWNRIRKSVWWKTEKVGAVSCHGTIQKDGEVLPAVLKIQGTKPQTCEVDMINAFASQNKSNIIRAPKIYAHLPWDQEKQFEAFVAEDVNGKVIVDHRPAFDEELEEFFRLYEEYRTNCRNSPWIAKGQQKSYREKYEAWRAAVGNILEKDKFGLPEDEHLVASAVEILEKNIGDDDLEFVHGHLTPGDLLKISEDEVVIFSNLMWGWRVPFYDAVFGYHWHMLGMERTENLTEELWLKERDRWLEKIFGISEVKSNSENIKFVKLALLERAMPALMADRFMMDQTKPSAGLITKLVRKELQKLISELS